MPCRRRPADDWTSEAVAAYARARTGPAATALGQPQPAIRVARTHTTSPRLPQASEVTYSCWARWSPMPAVCRAVSGSSTASARGWQASWTSAMIWSVLHRASSRSDRRPCQTRATTSTPQSWAACQYVHGLVFDPIGCDLVDHLTWRQLAEPIDQFEEAESPGHRRGRGGTPTQTPQESGPSHSVERLLLRAHAGHSAAGLRMIFRQSSDFF